MTVYRRNSSEEIRITFAAGMYEPFPFAGRKSLADPNKKEPWEIP
jgi:hypothetical protein